MLAVHIKFSAMIILLTIVKIHSVSALALALLPSPSPSPIAYCLALGPIA